MSKSVSFTIAPDRCQNIDGLIRKALKEAGLDVKVSDLVPLDHRYSNNEEPAWGGYERYCDVKSGRTVYVGLASPSDPQVSVKDKADKYAQGKAEKKLARRAAREERKAARGAKRAEPKAAKAKAEPKAKA